jgi:formylglycine-generating enzyme required for sulfatase activity/dienelactone hydrolase
MSDQLDRLKAALADRYAIDREIGSGGMATVYLAVDLKHERQVALKVLRPELAAVLGAERFVQEIKTTANLQHPHILPLYDSGEAAGFLYYVMPYVDGESLRDTLAREGQLDLAAATRIAIEVAEALDFAHRRGVIHRDIKPENILLQDGKVLVADFGIALAVSEAGSGRLTETGLSLGSPRYMSPEQAAGERDLDSRSDIYALGAVLYEMLTGATPFSAASLPELIARIVTETPARIGERRPDVPPATAAVVDRALAPNRDARFATAAEFAAALAPPAGPSTPRLPARTRRVFIGAAAVVAVAGALVGVRWFRDTADRRWVQEVAIPGIEQLVEAGRFAGAYGLAREALLRRPDDPTLTEYLSITTLPVDIASAPPGATVQFRGYRHGDSVWFDAGVTPLEQFPLPAGQLRVRFARSGYHPLEVSMISEFGSVTARLVPEEESGDMLWVPAGTDASSAMPMALDSFRLDRFEVTNRAFQDFVAAGGYEDSTHWVEPFVRNGRPVSWDDAMETFVDRTGRQGPATWELSQHSAGRADHPVGGVSWYEAAAFCRANGKALPTYYHWRHAAGFTEVVWDHILTVSNFSGDSTIAVGSLGGIGPSGTHDMAGNVREWVQNATGESRHILGGAWTDPEYLYADGDAADPWSRDPRNGFRCAAYESAPATALLDPIEQPFFDFNRVQPVDDATFAIFRRFYEYVPTDLAARVEATDTARHWIRQRVSYTAAYGGERIAAYVFLPRNAEPPFQTVVYFPGSSAFSPRASENPSELALISYVPRSGRVLVYPMYKGSYERPVESRARGIARRQWTVWVTQDLHRTVDYVTERSDLRSDALGFLGLSLGAEIAVPVALEKRFRALVLVGGAFDPVWRDVVMPENAPWNFASRITTPTMLINGRRDFMHPYETGQVPYFDAFDVPDRDKEFVVLEAGHIPPWNEVIRHTLRWYDRYLGEVQ